MRRQHRRRCECGALVQTTVNVQRPKCQMCRREELGLPSLPEPDEPRTAYWRAYKRRQRRAA